MGRFSQTAQAMLYSILIAGTLTAGCSAAENSSPANNTKLGITAKAKPPEENIDELTEAEISKYMAMDNVEEILKGVNVAYITPDNFKKEVYGSDKPVLMLFYGLKKGLAEEKFVAPSKREAIIFRELAKRYEGEIKFVAHNDMYGPRMPGHTITRISVENGIISIPSLAMYSLFDLTKGETSERNDGRIKQIDILRGGPTADKWINPWIPWLAPWIETNITFPNGEYVVRLNNSGDDKKVFYSK